MTMAQNLSSLRGARRWQDPQPTWLMRAAKIGHDDDRVQRLKAALWQGDPLADDVAAWIADTRGGWALFQRALTEGIGALDNPPAPLAALFAQVDRRPDWVDDHLLRAGAAAVLRSGICGSTALGAFSLMIGYAADAAVKPLAMTANLSEGARKRLSETSRWTIDCALSGTLPRDSEGFRSTLRVRLMHAFVRQKLRQSPEWQADAWGAPIPQLDMVATQLEFSTVFILGCAVQGLVFSAAEREAVMHYYRYVCWLMGTDEALQPTTFREGLELAVLLKETSNMGPDADSIALTQGLFKATRELLDEQPGAAWLKDWMHYRSAALTRLMLGDDVADRMAVPPAPWKASVLLQSLLTLGVDQALGLSRAGRAWRARLGRNQFVHALRAENFGFLPTLRGEKLIAEAS